MIRRNTFRALALLLPLAAGTALAAPEDNAELRACIARAEAKPDEGLEAGLRWQERGGGDPARLCQALALFHKGQFETAATRLEELVPTLGKDDPKAGASLLARAGWAWLRAGKGAKAESAYTAALARQPEDVDLYIDRAFARAEGERFWDAVADLDAAIRRAPTRAEAYLYRAAAHKALSNHRQAAADVDRALELKPGDPEAILLRANIKAAAGNAAGAKDDWKLVVRLAPDTSSAKAARLNLERFEKVEAEAKTGAGVAKKP